MIAYVSLATDWTPGSKYAEQYRTIALPWIEKQPDAFARTGRYDSNILVGLNDAMSAVVPSSPEAIVFVHPDCAILDPLFTEKVRRYLADPTVGVIGVIGSVGASSMHWWVARERHGWVHHKEGEEGVHFDRGDHEVDTVDGLLFVLTPRMFDYRWPADEYPAVNHHAYPEEVCCSAKERGLKVIQIDSEVRHATTPGFAGGKEAWDAANEVFRRRWWRRLARTDFKEAK